MNSIYPGIKPYTAAKLSPVKVTNRPSNIKDWHNYFTVCDPISGRGIGSADTNYKNRKVYWTALHEVDVLACHSSYYADIEKWTAILGDVVTK